MAKSSSAPRLPRLKVFIIGAIPPPRGGVSTHVERLRPHLAAAGMDHCVLDHSRHPKSESGVISVRTRPWSALATLLRPRPGLIRVLHWPLSNVSLGRLGLLVLARLSGVRPTLTLVASPTQTLNGSRKKRLILSLMLHLAQQVVVANADFRALLDPRARRAGKMTTISAFIPQGVDNRQVPADILAWARARRPLFLTYAHGPDFHEGHDLYGLDLIIEAVAALRKSQSNPGCLVVLPAIIDAAYFAALEKKIAELDLSANFHFALGSHIPFTPLLPEADLFIRATNTDGDALTVREALAAGIPTVVSDACPRPTGTILFRNRTTPDLVRAIREGLARGRRATPDESGQDNARRFIAVFRRAAGSPE